MSSPDCSIKNSFYRKGMIILFKNVFMLPLPVISQVRQYKETKTQSLDFILEVSKNVSALEQRFIKL